MKLMNKYQNFKKTRLIFTTAFITAAVFSTVWFVLQRCINSSPGNDIDAFIQNKMRRDHLPGLVAAIVNDQKVLWCKGYGMANIEKGIPATPFTIFMLGSLSKTVTATAIMQLYESGKFKLDEDINHFLPGSLRNPKYPDVPITFRMLLTHTSSLRRQDNLNLAKNLYFKDGPLRFSLHEEFRQHFLPDGKYYAGEKKFMKFKPGEHYEYSSLNLLFVAYLVERISGINFEQYCSEHIFLPLGIQNASWHVEPDQSDRTAMPYDYKKGKFLSYGYYDVPFYPSGGLRINIQDLAKFFIAFINHGSYGDMRILKRETVEEMRRIQYPDIASFQGITWYYAPLDGKQYLGHSGMIYGVSADMYFDPAKQLGVILFINTDSKDKTLIDLFRRFFKEAESICPASKN